MNVWTKFHGNPFKDQSNGRTNGQTFQICKLPGLFHLLTSTCGDMPTLARPLTVIYQRAVVGLTPISFLSVTLQFFFLSVSHPLPEHLYQHTNTHKIHPREEVRAHVVCASDGSTPQLKVHTSPWQEKCGMIYGVGYVQTTVSNWKSIFSWNLHLLGWDIYTVVLIRGHTTL